MPPEHAGGASAERCLEAVVRSLRMRTVLKGGRLEELTNADWRKLLAETERVYRANEVDITTEYYHMPNSFFYPSFFAWDSGFHAVVMSRIDLEKSKRELETLFRQVTLDGHMPHEVLIPCAATRARLLRNFARRLVQWEYDSNGASHMVDPPIYVTSAEIVFEASRDTEWLARIWPDICRLLDYLIDKRDLFGDGLVSIVHPWEAGTDLSPHMLPALGIDPASRTDVLQATFYAALLYRFCNRLCWDTAEIRAANKFVVEDLTMNTITIRALSSASRLALELGDEVASAAYDSRAREMSRVLDEVCWDEESGCYYPRWDPSEPKTVRVRTAASVLPVFSGLCPPERVARMIKEHVLDESQFWMEHLFPFNPADELEGNRPWMEKKLWAGHCIWINFNWMIAIGLHDNGYGEEARELTRRTARMIGKSGFWEYYDSRTGEGRRMRDFTWPGLVLDMMARFFPEIL
jgi:glycogen debranching enzyme